MAIKAVPVFTDEPESGQIVFNSDSDQFQLSVTDDGQDYWACLYQDGGIKITGRHILITAALQIVRQRAAEVHIPSSVINDMCFEAESHFMPPRSFLQPEPPSLAVISQQGGVASFRSIYPRENLGYTNPGTPDLEIQK